MSTTSILGTGPTSTVRQPNHRWYDLARSTCSVRILLSTLIVWCAFAILPRASDAGMITYTWASGGDGSPSSGDLVVNSVAQTNGQIQFADVVNFSFTVHFQTSVATFTTADLANTDFPFAISTATAGPTGSFAELFATNSSGSSMNVEFDQNWNLVAGQGLAASLTPSGPFAGSESRWIITGAAVPEPSTLTLTAMAAVCGVACAAVRNRRARRRPATRRRLGSTSS